MFCGWKSIIVAEVRFCVCRKYTSGLNVETRE